MSITLFILLYILVAFTLAIVFWSTITPVQRLKSSMTYNHTFASKPRLIGLECNSEFLLDHLPVHLPLAILLTEDPYFFEHNGFSFRSIQARISQWVARKGPFGSGSSISQQLIKRVFTFSEPSLLRKLKEAILTVRLEKHMKKVEILELYLRNASWGIDTVGVEAASRRYFGISASEVSPAQAAVLAVLLRRPERLGSQFLQASLPDHLQLEIYHKIRNLNLAFTLAQEKVDSNSSESLEDIISWFNERPALSRLSESQWRNIAAKSFDDYGSLRYLKLHDSTSMAENRGGNA